MKARPLIVMADLMFGVIADLIRNLLNVKDTVFAFRGWRIPVRHDGKGKGWYIPV